MLNGLHLSKGTLNEALSIWRDKNAHEDPILENKLDVIRKYLVKQCGLVIFVG